MVILKFQGGPTAMEQLKNLAECPARHSVF